MIQYLDKKGRLLFVAQGIGHPPSFGTFYRGLSGAKHRVKSSALPMRYTREEAERDFYDYVLKYRLTPVTVSHRE